MAEALTATELAALVARVFVPTPEDRSLGIMIDLPDGRVADDAAWEARREIAAAWVDLLESQAAKVGYHTRLLLYPNVHTCSWPSRSSAPPLRSRWSPGRTRCGPPRCPASRPR